MIIKRNGPRHKVGVLAALMTAENKFICFGAIEDVSSGGAKLKLTKEIQVPDKFVIVLSSKYGPRRNCSVAWRKADRIGVRFMPIKEPENVM